jgi:prevent-host-death family protein
MAATFVALHRRDDLAILMAMTLSEQMALGEVKNRLSEIIERIERVHGRVVITKHGHPSAVIMSIEDLESLEDTLDILSDSKAIANIRKARKEIAAGKTVRLTKDDALGLIRRK